MKRRKTQMEIYEEARKKIALQDAHFMEMINDKCNPLTRADLEKLIQKRPALWAKYTPFLNNLK